MNKNYILKSLVALLTVVLVCCSGELKATGCYSTATGNWSVATNGTTNYTPACGTVNTVCVPSTAYTYILCTAGASYTFSVAGGGCGGSWGSYYLTWYSFNGSAWTYVTQGQNSITGTAPYGGANNNIIVCYNGNGCASYPSTMAPAWNGTSATLSYVQNNITTAGTVTQSPASGGTVCSAANVTYTMSAPTNGTFSYFQYQWNASPPNSGSWYTTNPATWPSSQNGASVLYVDAVVTQGACTAVSNIVNVTVQSTANSPGTITAPSTICLNGSGTITSTAAATTGTPASTGPLYDYYWQRTSAPTTGWNSFQTGSGSTTAALPTAVTGTAGTYILTRNSYWGCAGEVSANTVNLTVYPAFATPTISGGTSPLCTGGTTGTLTATGSGGSGSYTYLWYVNGVSTGVTTSTYNPTLSTLGTNTIYCAVTDANGCGSANSNTLSFTVNAQPAIGGLSSASPANGTTICVGFNTGTVTGAAGSGGGTGASDVWTYSLNNGSTTASYTNSSAINTSSATGNVIVYATRTAGTGSNCTAAGPTAICTWTEGTNPVAPTLNVPSPATSNTVCAGFGVSATTNPGSGGSTGAADSYQYSINGGGSWASYTPGATISTTGATGSIIIQSQRSGGTYGCTGTGWVTIATWTVSTAAVAPTLNVATPLSGNTVCTSFGNVSATTNAGSGGSTGAADAYQYSINGGSTWSSYTPGTNIATAGATGSIIIQAERTGGSYGCTTAGWNTLATWPIAATVVAPTLNTPTPATSNSICAGYNVSATTFAGSGGSTGAADAYQYSINGGSTYNTYTPGSTINTTGATGSVIIRAERTGGSYGCTTVGWNTLATWSINAATVAPTLNTASPASGSTVCTSFGNVSATTNAGSGGSTGAADAYQYSTNGGSTWSSYTPGNNIATAGATGSIIVQAERTGGTYGCSTAGWNTIATWLIAAPVVAPTLNTPTPANGTTVCTTYGNVSATITAGSGGSTGAADAYQFSTNGGGTWSSYTSGTNIATSGATTSIIVQGEHTGGSYGCTTAGWNTLATWPVNQTPVATRGTTFSDAVCSTAGSYSVLAGYGYTSANGTVLWTASSTSGTTGSLSGTTGYTPTYTFSAADQAASGPVTVTLTMTVSNSPCAPASTTFVLTINPTPVNTASQSTSACAASTFSYTPTGTIIPSGTSYAWSAPTGSGFTGSGLGGSGSTLSDNLTITSGTTTTTATYSVTPTAGSCSGTPFTVSVTLYYQPSLSNQSTQSCSGQLFIYSPTGTIPLGTTYAWSTPTGSGFTGGASATNQNYLDGNLTLVSSLTPATATYSVTPTNGTCSGTPFNVSVTINSSPIIGAQTTSNCTNTMFHFTPTSGAIPPGTTYAWNNPTGSGYTGGTSASGQSDINGILINSGTTPVTAIYSVTATAGACSGTPFNVSVTVNPNPIISNQSTSACSGVAINYAPTGSNTTGNTYAWSTPSGSGFTGGAAGSGATVTATLTNSGSSAVTATYSVTPTSGNGCTGVGFNVTVTLNPSPSAAVVSDNLDACNGGHTAYVNVTGGSSPYSFTLTFTGSASATTQNYTGPVPAELDAQGATSITVSNIVDANGCPAASVTGSPVSYSGYALTPGNTQACMIPASSTQVFFDASAKLMAKITSGGTALGSTTVITSVDGSVQTFGPSHPQSYLQRHFQITPTTNAAANVCLYISDGEVSALNTASASDDHSAPAYYQTFATNLSNANVTKYDGGSETPLSHTTSLTQVITSITATHNPVVDGATYNGVWEMCFNVSGFSGFYVHANNVNNDPLPVTLVSFTATAEDNKFIQLDWSTATEVNNSGFQIERSVNGTDFEAIGWAEGHGNSTVMNSYRYSDLSALPGIVYYYRLKQVDVDGNYKYSNIVSATLTGALGFTLESLIPNPANSQISVGVISNVDASATIKITDMLGRVVLTEPWPMAIGYNTQKFDLSNLAVGAYTVTVYSADVKTSMRLVISR